MISDKAGASSAPDHVPPVSRLRGISEALSAAVSQSKLLTPWPGMTSQFISAAPARRIYFILFIYAPRKHQPRAEEQRF